MNDINLRTILFFLLSIVCAYSSFAQDKEDVEKVSFVIKDATTRHPLSHATCRVFTYNGDYYNYGISDYNGSCSIILKTTDILEFSCLGYETIKQSASSYSTKSINEVLLTPSSIELQEVVVKAPPIRFSNDTISYNVKSFFKPGDIHLEDILKKLPGIKVSENGSVSYQGKAINKFYIEGKDLLGNSYNQATRNMPIDAVVTVEILENHQPIKMLKDQQFSDKAALNIKINNKHKVRPFGELKGSAGFSPFRWDNSLFLTQILGRSQLLISAKMNNIGNSLSEETQEHIDITDLDAYEPILPSVLSNYNISEFLPTNRYINNNAYSAGINYLIGLSKESNLRFNVLFHRDHSSSTKQTSYTYGGEIPISFKETNTIHNKSFSILPIIKYELNNDKAFVSNEFKYSLTNTKFPNKINSNQILISEDIDLRPTYIQNYLNSVFYIKKQILQVKSFMRYFYRKDRINCLSDSTNFYDIAELFELKSFITKNNVSTSFQLFGNELDISSDIYYRSSSYIYDGNVHKTNTKVKLSPSYLHSLGTDRSLSIEIPIAFFYTKIDSVHKHTVTMLPSIKFRYQFNDKWNINITALYNVDNATSDFYSSHILRTSYRTVYHPSNKIFFNQGHRASIRLAYRNLATMLFSNISISYSNNKKDYIYDYKYTNSLTQISVKQEKNRQRTFLINGALDKSFIDAGVSLKSELNYTLNTHLISQTNIKTDNYSNIFGLNLNLNFQKLKWLRFMFGATGTLYWEKNELYNSDVLKNFIVQSSFYFFPTQYITMKLKYQNYINEISSSKYKTCGMFDFEMNYKLNKRWELEASFFNILNTHVFAITQDNGINTFSSNLPLRGREFLIGAIWRF